MARILINISTQGLFSGWGSEDVEAVDINATKTKVAQVIFKRVQSAIGAEFGHGIRVNVNDEDKDGVCVENADTAEEERSLTEIARDELTDFEWWDGNAWSVAK